MTDNETNEPRGSDDSQQPDQEAGRPEAAVLKPGAQLAECRVKAGLTVENVAARLKMTVRQVNNLEADNYDALHGIAISRGFVRAYAKLLQVDPEPLVAMFPSNAGAIKNAPSKATTQPKRSMPTDTLAGSRRSFHMHRDFPVKLISAVIVVVLLVVAALAARQMGVLQFNLPSVQKPASQAKESASRMNPTSVQSSGSVSTELVPPKTTVMSDNVPAAGEAKQDTASATSAPVPDNKTEPAAKPVEAEQAQGNNALVMRFRADSWVQIVNDDSTVLFERLVKAGETEAIDIKEPVSVTLGYAPGVEASLRGVPVELKTAENSTVARLKLK